MAIDEPLFSVTMMQILIEKLVALGVISADDQRAMYLEAAAVLEAADNKADADTITYLKFLAYGSDADSDELE